MSFTQTAIILSFILYCVIAVGNLMDRNYPMFIIWTSYSVSQIGFLLEHLTRKVTE